MQNIFNAATRCLIIAFILFACQNQRTESDTPFQENYRPQIHFTPETNWMNDPNGLVYLDGEYHLFYQYNPYGNTWGHMSWGHAVSTDLLHWQHLPIALREYQDRITNDSTMIFSGTAVVDTNNSAGFGANALIAIFTSHVHKDNKGLLQHQSLAYSTDKGRTWTYYKENPILSIQRKDFRDPKVFWYEPQQKWVMALVVPDRYTVQFYDSKNLLNWNLTGSFTDSGDTTRIWECPDLYELPVENENKTKWVLSLSGGHPQGSKFVGMQYFVGEFDGKTFLKDTSDRTPSYVDFGKDFYAGIVYNNLDHPQKKKVMIGWVNNWTYGNQIPTSPWRSAMSLPRELSLARTSAGFFLQQKLVGLEKLRAEEITAIEKETLNGPFELTAMLSEETALELFTDAGDRLVISYVEGSVSVDRVKTKTDFHPDFASVESYDVPGYPATVKVRLVIDQSIAEVFINDGLGVITEQFYFQLPTIKVKIAGDVTISDAYHLKSVWRK